ncbi:MAG: DUF58 domain-containing protein [Pseudomonadota bacterium]|nr:DUF58 domain-containing protein [Pseudomonadota bacterium]
MNVARLHLPTPASYARARFRAWWQSRLPRTDTQLLTQRNIYILPTRAGWMFAATIVVLLLASINYQLNLGFVLSFLLAGAGIASMHVTHGTLRALTLHLKPPLPAFAGSSAMLDVVVSTPNSARFGIGLRLLDAAPTSLVWVDVQAAGQVVAQLAFVPLRRGRHTVEPLVAETRFPLGLFRAWTVWRPAAQLLVYPQAEPGAPALPAALPIAGGPALSRHSEGGEIDGVRAYRRGDPMKLVAWKKAAQAIEAGSGLVSRDTSIAARQELWLEWAASGAGDRESRLSRLTAWVLVANRNGVAFGLRLPGLELAPAEGELQRLRCLEALALQ